MGKFVFARTGGRLWAVSISRRWVRVECVSRWPGANIRAWYVDPVISPHAVYHGPLCLEDPAAGMNNDWRRLGLRGSYGLRRVALNPDRTTLAQWQMFETPAHETAPLPYWMIDLPVWV
jgi:hypothetical protein